MKTGQEITNKIVSIKNKISQRKVGRTKDIKGDYPNINELTLELEQENNKKYEEVLE